MIFGYSRHYAPDLPLTNLTNWFDFSNDATIFKTYSAVPPIGIDPATADADPIAVVNSVVPSSPVRTLHNFDIDPARYPLLRKTTPLLGPQCLDFDGSNDIYTFGNSGGSSLTTAQVFTVAGKTILCSFRCEVLPPSPGNLQLLVSDGSSEFNLGIYNDTGTVKAIFQNHDAINFKNAFSAAITANTNYVVVGRHDGVNVYISLNGGTEVVGDASGNTTSLTNGVYVGGQNNLFLYNGRMGEIATYDVALTGATLAQAIAHFTAKWL